VPGEERRVDVTLALLDAVRVERGERAAPHEQQLERLVEHAGHDAGLHHRHDIVEPAAEVGLVGG
jgi:hypothetical protein